MGSGDLVTGRLTGLAADLSPELSVERLAPSSPALQGHAPVRDVQRKARRRSRSEEEHDEHAEAEEDLEASPEAGDGLGSVPEHKIDSLA